MRALYLTAPGSFAWREAPEPAAPKDWVRIRMRYVGICGSDVHYFVSSRIGNQVVTSPFILGHEGSGEVLDGAGQFPSGLPIYLEPAIPCHRCDQCLEGRENTCRNMKFLGNPSESDGCMREEISMPAECIAPIPGWMSLEEAVLLEPLCIGAYAVERSQSARGCRAAIVGAGPIGLSVLLGMGSLDPRLVVVSEPVEARRDAAVRLGASLILDPAGNGAAEAVCEASGGGVEVAFDCAGTQEAIDDAARMLRPGGTLVLIGIPEGTDRITYDPHLMRRREITVVNVRRQNRMLERAVRILEVRRDAAAVMLTHRFPPSQAVQAFRMVERREDRSIKAILEF